MLKNAVRVCSYETVDNNARSGTGGTFTNTYSISRAAGGWDLNASNFLKFAGCPNGERFCRIRPAPDAQCVIDVRSYDWDTQ